jgi:hypothetical protein
MVLKWVVWEGSYAKFEEHRNIVEPRFWAMNTWREEEELLNLGETCVVGARH